MFFITLPFYALVAYLDYKTREIPEWLVALCWFLYPASMTVFPPSDMVGSLTVPIIGLGIFWLFQLGVEKIYKDRIFNRAYVKYLRFGLGEVFILPLMYPIIVDGGWAMMYPWIIGAGLFAAMWGASLKKGDPQKRKGIPFLTFAFLSALVILFVRVMLIRV
jgi:hypothetical protein